MVYVYLCKNCSYTFEVMKSVHQMETPEHCERCGAEAARQLTAANFHLKGGGWHKTDYGKRGPKR